MNAFPNDYVAHNLPLVVLSGLGEEQNDRNAEGKARNLLSEGGFRIKTNIPPVTGDTAETLRQALLSLDSNERPWHGRGSAQSDQNAVFRILTAGRTYTLPPRKAPPPTHSPRLRPANGGTSPPPQLILHSPLSPLTPSSPLYPDGIATALWITKHQSRLPSIFITFFTLVADSNTSTLQDNKLKSEINNIRSILTSTNYKSRLVVVFLGDGEIQVPEIEERLSNIRRATILDTKSIFFVASGLPQNEIFEFSKSMLNSLYAGCLEYYRELSKHARRKRNRNVVPQPTIPPTSGTSQTLSLAGWNVRYEFKLAVFAEFRQEMEAALRNYEAAYEGLVSSEVLETIPSWSPRFNEARMLADIISIRIIRCVLWIGQTTNAVKWWINHRNRVQNLINRKSIGTETYGWEAWQSIWSRTMAELVQRAQVLSPSEKDTSKVPSTPLFVDAEKTLPGGHRYSPWESLHHEGYWLNLAQRYTNDRRTRASKIPEEDRASPGQSPASLIASKSHLYDKYLVLEPYKEFPLDGKRGYDYSQEIIQVLDAAVKHFSVRDQTHMTEILQLKKAVEHMKSSSWEDALSILRSTWESQSWRKAGWWILVHQISQGLLTCAIEVGNNELAAQLQWQLTHPLIHQYSQKREEDVHDFELLLEAMESQAALETEHSLTRLLPRFAFATEEGHVGEAMDVQISLQHLEANRSINFQLVQVKIVFDGGLKPIYLIDDRDEIIDEGIETVSVTEIELEDDRSRKAATRRSSMGAAAALTADVNLGLKAGHTKVFQTHVVPREAGDVSVASIHMTFKKSGREMTVTTSDTADTPGQWWETRKGKPIPRPYGRSRSAAAARVLPKPPKVEISIINMRKVFYTNESIELAIQCENHEEQAVLGSIEAKLISPGKNNAMLSWEDGEIAANKSESDTVAFVQQLSPRGAGDIQVGGHTTQIIVISNTDEAIDHELEILMNYQLQSSPETKLTKLFTVDLPIIRPFEANFSFHSRLHEEIWPNFFSGQSVSQTSENAAGIKQQFLITAVICSFATEDVAIESTRLTTQKIVGGATCTISPGTLRQSGTVQKNEKSSSVLIHPEETRRFGFDMTIQKLVLGHRQPVAVDVLLELTWRRQGSEQLNTSVLQVPRFLAPSSEPRVLLQATKEQNVPGLYRLSYTLENPSLHFLTFNLTMESSDDFAFSGIKSKSLSLVPISRHEVMFRILPNKTDAWIRVHLEVLDAYFGQTLRIQPAADGIRVDKQGSVLVWIE